MSTLEADRILRNAQRYWPDPVTRYEKLLAWLQVEICALRAGCSDTIQDIAVEVDRLERTQER